MPTAAGANGPGSQDDPVDQLTSGCSNGNGALVGKLVATDGSVGYSDISTARSNSPSLAITPEANDNDTYWTQVENGSNAFTEPTSSRTGSAPTAQGRQLPADRIPGVAGEHLRRLVESQRRHLGRPATASAR